jgi:hypothetical protein
VVSHRISNPDIRGSNPPTAGKNVAEKSSFIVIRMRENRCPFLTLDGRKREIYKRRVVNGTVCFFNFHLL